MYLKRSFLSVGHGAFYCERFILENKTYNIVFDCGTKTSTKLLGREIDYMLPHASYVDAVFISHLHNDHVNGLATMIERGMKIGAIYLPYMDEEVKAIVSLGCTINKCFDAVDAVDKLCDKLRREQNTRIVRILPYDSKDDEENDDPFPLDIMKRQISNGTIKRFEVEDIKSGRKIFVRELGMKWIFKPVNFQQDKIATKMRKVLKEIAQKGGYSLKEIGHMYVGQNISLQTKREIRRVYEMYGNLNLNSMVVYSGPMPSLNDDWRRQVLYNKDDDSLYEWTIKYALGVNSYCLDATYKLGCLYTGDYCASSAKSWEKMKSKYKAEWKIIGCVQLPHHGSVNNFNDEFAEMDACFFASTRSNDRCHPGRAVVDKLRSKKRDIFLISEYINTRVTLVAPII